VAFSLNSSPLPEDVKEEMNRAQEARRLVQHPHNPIMRALDKFFTVYKTVEFKATLKK
jgi:hypothetical protein